MVHILSGSGHRCPFTAANGRVQVLGTLGIIEMFQGVTVIIAMMGMLSPSARGSLRKFISMDFLIDSHLKIPW